MDELTGMRVFVKVVETGGLSVAARALGLAPPSVTRRINELEDTLGVRLLNRTTRKLSLTEAGEIYYERTRDIVQTVEEANLAVTEKRAAPSGTLFVTVPAGISRLHVAPAVAAFRAQYPKVRVVLRITDRVVDLIDESLDIAIRVGRLEDSSLIARKLGVARRMVCASPAYLKRAGRPKHPEELSNHDCLTFRSHPGSNVWRFRKGKKTFDVQATGPFYTDDGETLASAACAGLGLILVPEWLAGPEVNAGKLVEVLTDYTADPADTPLHAVYAPGPYTAPKIRAFVDFLAGRFSRDYAWSQPH
ncbi:MAG: LysR family transcriptional regulator [Hyphomicrobiaceae bacterium]